MNEQSKILWSLVEKASKMAMPATWKTEFDKVNRAPVNPNLSTTAKTLLQKLYSLRGSKILTGQHDYLEAPFTYSSQILGKTGNNPILKGLELGGTTGQSSATLHVQRTAVVEASKAWHNKGGIVTLSYHAAYPGTATTFANVQRQTTQEEFNQIITPGTDLHTLLVNEIDNLAVYLKLLRDADVPVLWRPYHEMNGGWFWWGKKSNFSALWEIMYDRYVNFHGLNNLIWVWCPNAKNSYCDAPRNFYVGYDRTDVLALDIYSNDFSQVHHDDLLNIGCGKLIAIGENGELPSLSNLSSTQNQYSWFLTWGKMLTENNTDPTIQAVFSSTYALNRNQVLAEGDGLLGQYFSGISFDEYKAERVDPIVNFSWANGAPITGVGTDDFSVRWTGFIMPKSTEQYKIITYSDDGARVYINNVLLTNKWYNGANWASGLINLVKDIRYEIRVEFYDASAAATMALYWESPTVTREIIPQNCLYSE